MVVFVVLFLGGCLSVVSICTTSDITHTQAIYIAILLAMKSSITASLAVTVGGHGIFWSPTSRAIQSEQSGYMEDATSIISEPMPDVTSESRDYPGKRFMENQHCVRCSSYIFSMQVIVPLLNPE